MNGNNFLRNENKGTDIEQKKVNECEKEREKEKRSFFPHVRLK
mgnify:CR=1 FL=1